MQLPAYRQNLITRLERIVHSEKCSISSLLLFARSLKDLIWLCLHTGRLALARPTPCSVVIGKRWFRRILTLGSRTPSLKIWDQMRILQGSYLEPSSSYSMKSRLMRRQNPSSEYSAPFCKSITKKFMTCSKTSPNPRPSTSTSRN